MKYRKKPVVIEAVQFDRSKAEKDVAKYYPMVTDMAKLTTKEGTEEREDRFFISTLECNITVKDGDYIIQGADDEFYLRKPYIFEKIYEVASQQPKLNENQQIVLEWLKEQVSIGSGLQYVLWEFTDNVYEDPAEYSVSEQTKAWLELTEQEQFQVLAAFAQWGLEQEDVE
ncbi:hypothetical protein [Enterococcus faecium]|uniref:hypothetical protein n=1 Tax=Enterococcus faecium TaxID=1352 RepID=UPI0015E815FD|nr:hypothetical protein [Enterococcus faecium]